VASSDGGPGTIPGTKNVATAFRVDGSSGALTPHSETAALPHRPVHCSVDRAGQFLLTAYNYPSHLTVHRINPDGTIGAEVGQREKLDVGIFAHQVLTTPENRTAIMVTRGNDATADKPEDPGALKIYRFSDGVLTNLASIAPGSGLGFGARHIDFHPTKPWVFVSVERQNQLYVYERQPDGNLSRDPLFVTTSLAAPDNPQPGQAAGAIHVHPNGRFVYLTNRNSGTTEAGGKKVFAGGENTVAVFAIDQATGEPTLIQNAEAHTNHLRTFSIDPSGRLMIAASIQPIALRDGTMLAAALVLYRIGADGRLELARKYDVDTGRFMQFWTGMITLP
jgi:6-phosphogluconolactonase (cycloisomerase 2 family)